MSEIKLLQCPFCGGEAHLFVNDGVKVICPSCGATSKCLVDSMTARGVSGNATEAVIKAWNHRKPIEDMVEQLDKASDYYECDEQGREHVQMVDLSKVIDIVRGRRE